jgi:protein-S-isoprenylcysteine O-methyltransferase Ste14
MKNVISSAITITLNLFLFFGFGVFINPQIIFDFHLWVVIFAIFIIFATQPKMNWADLFNRDDNYSMLGILLMAIVVVNIAVIEWSIKSEQLLENDLLIQIEGFTLIWGGMVFRIYAIKTLSIYFSVLAEIQENHQLCEKGVYKVIRHPSYTGVIITLIGILIWLECFNYGGLSLFLIGLAYYHRIRQEEKLLTGYFGELYESYKKRTGAILPKMGELIKIIKKILPKK